MTHIIIHNNSDTRSAYLLTLAGSLMGKKLKIDSLMANPDMHTVSKGELSIGIDDVKALQKEMLFRPFAERCQIGMIFNAHNLTVEAQNALLKTLEEQPPETEYILLVNNEKNLLPTIVSRGVKHYVKTKAKTQEKKATRPKILDADLVERFALIEGHTKEGTLNQLLESLLYYFRDQLQNAVRKDKTEETTKYKRAIETVVTAQVRLKANGNKKLVGENMILHLEDI